MYDYRKYSYNCRYVLYYILHIANEIVCCQYEIHRNFPFCSAFKIEVIYSWFCFIVNFIPNNLLYDFFKLMDDCVSSQLHVYILEFSIHCDC